MDGEAALERSDIPVGNTLLGTSVSKSRKEDICTIKGCWPWC
jgi:hypothetical protein